jgi:tRNA-5-taurinomethyluridine 2-sulfurtransferase
MKIAMLLSGGVDSSVALALLKAQGHDVTAFYLKIWLEDELSFLGNCPWEEDLTYARKVCEQLDVPLKVVPLQREYHERVVSYVIAEVKAGRTPNPDIFCNQRIKFGAFFDCIGPEPDDPASNFEKVATGHYARVEDGYLKRVEDPTKDQTYFLSHLDQAQLKRTMFPLGEIKEDAQLSGSQIESGTSSTKASVRKLAQKFELATATRKDSQGICFLGKVEFNEFLRHHLGEQPGDIVEFETGETVGAHKGFWFHTIGQRRGLGLSGGPWYVVSKDPGKNIVYISKNYFSADKPRRSFYIDEPHWIGSPPQKDAKLRVKLRHGPEFYECKLMSFPTPIGHPTPGFPVKRGMKYKVTIDRDDQGIAPGQFAVFYDGDTCLGCAAVADDSDRLSQSTVPL